MKERSYLYYCRFCEEVTCWRIFGPHRRVEKHICDECGAEVLLGALGRIIRIFERSQRS